MTSRSITKLKEGVELIQRWQDEVKEEEDQPGEWGVEPCMCPLHSSGLLHLDMARKVCEQGRVLHQDGRHSSLE